MQLFVEQPLMANSQNDKTYGARRFDIKSTQQLNKNRKLLRKMKSNDDDDNGDGESE